MTKPTIEDVQSYVIEKNYNVDAYEFWSFYAQKGWKVGKSPMVDWHIALGRCNAKGWGKTAKSVQEYARRNHTDDTKDRLRDRYEDTFSRFSTAKLEDMRKDPGSLEHVLWLIEEVIQLRKAK